MEKSLYLTVLVVFAVLGSTFSASNNKFLLRELIRELEEAEVDNPAPVPSKTTPSDVENDLPNTNDLTGLGEGAEGHEGKEGTEGHEGEEGAEVHEGEEGAEEHEGEEGAEGHEGKEGTEGHEGEEGAEGHEGEEGAEGHEGEEGTEGHEGEEGAEGHEGEKGAEGHEGEEGAEGHEGEEGTEGHEGKTAEGHEGETANVQDGETADVQEGETTEGHEGETTDVHGGKEGETTGQAGDVSPDEEGEGQDESNNGGAGGEGKDEENPDKNPDENPDETPKMDEGVNDDEIPVEPVKGEGPSALEKSAIRTVRLIDNLSRMLAMRATSLAKIDKVLTEGPEVNYPNTEKLVQKQQQLEIMSARILEMKKVLGHFFDEIYDRFHSFLTDVEEKEEEHLPSVSKPKESVPLKKPDKITGQQTELLKRLLSSLKRYKQKM